MLSMMYLCSFQVDLSNNELGALGGKAVADALRVSGSLTQVLAFSGQ